MKYKLFMPNCNIDYWFIFNKSFNSLQILFRFIGIDDYLPIVNLKRVRAILGDEFIEGITMAEHPQDGMICFSLHVCTFKNLLNELQLDGTLDNYLTLYNHHPIIRLVVNGIK